MLEDTPAGLEAGRAAGAKIIGLSTTFAASALPADVVVRDFMSIELKPAGDGRLRITVTHPLDKGSLADALEK